MATLMLRLAAPLQAWGSNSKFNIRTTEREPTKSGVIGMIAAAMGIKRNEESTIFKELVNLRFGVRVEKEGILLKDFHMVHEKKDSHLTERYYLSDAVFLVAIESNDINLLKNIEDAIKNPVYPLFLGRRSCPPTLPIVLGIRNNKLIDALKNEPSLTKQTNSKRIIYESSKDGVLIQDVPISFSQKHRQYGYRKVTEEIIHNKEHDAFEEL